MNQLEEIEAKRFVEEFNNNNGSIIDKNIITLLVRDRENNFTEFRRGESYVYKVLNATQKSSSGISAQVTIETIDGDYLYRDDINLSKAPQRQRLEKSIKNIFKKKEYDIQYEEGEIDHDLARIEHLIAELLKQELLDDMRPKQPYIMTEKEKDEANKFIGEHPFILRDVLQAVIQLGVVGEERNCLMSYLVFTSRIMKRPLSVVVVGESSSGKSFLSKRVMQLIPPEGYKFITKATAQAFFHLPKDGMKHKIIYINELPGSEASDYAIRTAQSEGDLVLSIPVKDPVTGNIETVDKVVEGPVGFYTTTTKIGGLFHENETRTFTCDVDNSPNQTQRILEIETREGLGEKFELPEKELATWHNFQRLLETDLEVIIPFSREIFKDFPNKPVRIRRDIGKFKTLIRVITVLHQRFRKIEKLSDGRKIIYATPVDYYLACQIAGEMLFSSLYQMPGHSQNLLSVLRSQAESEFVEFTFCYDDIRKWMDWNRSMAYRSLKYLLINDFVRYAEAYDNKNKKSKRYFKMTDKQEHVRFLIPATELLDKYPCDKHLMYNPFQM